MLRDIWNNKAAYIACLTIIAIGLMTFTSMSAVKDNLRNTQEKFYTNSRFAQGFAAFRSMPKSASSQIQSIEGINQVEGKLTHDVRVLMNREDNVYLRLVSVDLTNPNRLNNAAVMMGSPIEIGKENILIGSKFFSANELSLKQSISVIINGRKKELQIAGTGQSPEFVYTLQKSTDFLPEPENFDVAYIPYDVLETLYQEKGIINALSFTLDPGTSYDDVKDEVETKLKKYGLISLVPRKDQTSHFFLDNEIVQLANIATSVPLLFLLISTAILYIVLKRLVEQQRSQIGMLKALGYSSREILLHYMSYAIFIGGVGGILGGLLGTVLSNSFTQLYKEYFNLPGFEHHFSIQYFLLGIVLSLLFSLFAGYSGAKRVLGLEPAEAMRPTAPPPGKNIWIEKIPYFVSMLTVQGRMAIRNTFRSKGRSIFTLLGVMFTFSLMATLFSFQNLFDRMVMDQFTKVQHYDLKINYSAPLRYSPVLYELDGKEGVQQVEPLLEVPATLKYRYHKEDTLLLGIASASALYTVVDQNYQKVDLSSTGLVLSKNLADKLEIHVGDRLHIESPYAKDDVVYAPVEKIIPQYIGSNGYMQIQGLNTLLGQENMSTSALLGVKGDQTAPLAKDLQDGDYVGTIENQQQLIQKYYDTVDTMIYTLGFMGVLAVITGFAILFNAGVISLSERTRELASLRVLGMTEQEVFQVISFEQWFLAFFGILLGIPLTFGMQQGLAVSMETDLYTMPVGLTPSVFIFALIGTILSMAIAGYFIQKRIHQFNLVEVLKERE